jgi:hypothetical protein
MAKRTHESDESLTKKQQIDPLLQNFLKDGYLVVPNILSERNIEKIHQDFWDWIAGFNTGILRHDPSTWTTTNWPPSIRGLIQHYGVGHAKFVWELREILEIRKVFAILHGLDDSKETKDKTQLVVSFDGVCLSKPDTTNVDPVKNSWAHMDQGPTTAGQFKMIQGLATLTDAGPGKGGLICYRYSNHLHGEFFKQFPEMAKKVGTNDWCKLELHHRRWYFDHGCIETQVEAPKGSLILWDSRCVHYAVRPIKGSLIPRAAIYLCYQARSDGTAKQLKKKREVFEARRMTSHWPLKSKMFATRMRDWGDETLKIRFPDQPTIRTDELTSVMKQLAGY